MAVGDGIGDVETVLADVVEELDDLGDESDGDRDQEKRDRLGEFHRFVQKNKGEYFCVPYGIQYSIGCSERPSRAMIALQDKRL